MDISTTNQVGSYFSSVSDLRTITPKYINTSSISSENVSGEKEQGSSQQSSQQSQEYQNVILELKARDQHVRAHERAHLAASGGYATGGASFTYQVGPDGNRYAIGGDVGIDTSPVQGDPEATIQKARIIQRAALAPSDPSSQDLKVHAQAAQMEMQARQELDETDQDQVANSEAESSGSAKESQNATYQNLNPDRQNFEARLRINS